MGKCHDNKTTPICPGRQELSQVSLRRSLCASENANKSHLVRGRLLCWLRGWRICQQCRTPRFNPWVGKIPRWRTWQPTPVFLPRKFCGQRRLVGYSLWSRKELDMTKQLTDFRFNAGYVFMEQAPELVVIRIHSDWKNDAFFLHSMSPRILCLSRDKSKASLSKHTWQKGR